MPTTEFSPCPINNQRCNERHGAAKHSWGPNEAACQMRHDSASLDPEVLDALRDYSDRAVGALDPRAGRFIERFARCPFFPPPATADHQISHNETGTGELLDLAQDVLDAANSMTDETAANSFIDFIETLEI